MVICKVKITAGCITDVHSLTRCEPFCVVASQLGTFVFRTTFQQPLSAPTCFLLLATNLETFAGKLDNEGK